MTRHSDYIPLPLTAHQATLAAFLVAVLVLTLVIGVVLSFISTAQRRKLRESVGDGWKVYIGALIFLMFVAALIAAGAVLFDTVRNVVAPPTGTASGPNLGAGALIATLLGAPFVIWATYIRERTLFSQREGQITDRISKAVEQLGAEKMQKKADTRGGPVEERTVPNVEVRIGGLLSLERISQDSVENDNGRDHVRVMEILCAYVRNNALRSGAKLSPWERYFNAKISSGPDDPPISDEQFAKEEGIPPTAALEYYISPEATGRWATKLPKPREDIQFALTIIGRRDADQRRHEARWGKTADPDAEWVFDITMPKLPDIIGPVDAEGMDRYKNEVNEWYNAIGTYAGYRIDLRDTNLQGADLSDAVLSGALLWNARLDGALLKKVRLEGAELASAWLYGASLRDARLDRAFLVSLRLNGADLTEARLDRADLRDAHLNKHTCLMKASLRGAVLFETDLIYVNLTQQQLDTALGDASVRLPRTLMPPAHWPDWRLSSLGEVNFPEEWVKLRADPEGYRPPPRPPPRPKD